MNRIIIAVCLLVILGGACYAYGREQLRDPDHLHMLFFDGQLPDANLRVRNLSEYDAAGVTYWMNEKVFVALGPHWNVSESDALRTIQHEACHVATWKQDNEIHGKRWKDCMQRFE